MVGYAPFSFNYKFCCKFISVYPFCAGVLYRDAGNITLAIDAYEQCLKIDPDSRNAGQVLILYTYDLLT